MPRYLALNYVELLNRERRHLLDRSLFPVPGQIESIEEYSHHGDLPSRYLSPWKPLVIENGVVEMTLEEEFDGLKLEGRFDALETYSTEEQQHNNSAAGSDVDLFERAAADLIIKTEIENIRRVSGIEDFNYEPINIDHCDITGDPVLFLLEELLDQSVVSPPILHTALPSVGALMKRLRPILVQDPLVDKNGQKYGMRLENPTISPTITNPITAQVESFTKEPLNEDEYSTAHLIENPLTLHRPFSPKPITKYINEELQSLVAIEGLEEIEDGEGLTDIGDMCKDLTQSRDRGGVVPLVTDRFLLASSFGDSVSDGSRSSAGLCFEDLNNTGLGTEVSMFESQLLECPEISSVLGVPDILGTELIHLFVFDDDTLLNERLLSVSDERRLFNRLRTLDHTFDSIASKVLPCPDIMVQLGDINNNLIDQSISTLQPMKLHGDLELSLPWDPVFYSAVSMRAAANSILTRTSHDTGSSDHTGTTDYNGLSVVSLGAIDIEENGFDMEYIRWVNGFDATLLSLNDPPPTTININTVTDGISTTSTTASLSLHSSLASTAANVSISSGFDSFLFLRGMGDVGGTVGGVLNDSINKADPSSVSLLSSGERNQLTISDSRSIIEPDSDLIFVKAKDRPVKRVEIQVPITGDYKRLLERLNSLTSSLLRQFLGVVRGVASKTLLSDVPIDSLKFFMKQQEMNCHRNTTDNYVSSVVLFIIGSLIHELLNTSIQSAMDLFNGLCNKYRTLVLSSHNHSLLLQSVREMVGVLYNQGLEHPKIKEIITRINDLPTNEYNKVVIVLQDKYVTHLSSTLIDNINKISGDRYCAVTVASDGSINEKFDQCNVIITPPSAISHSFPWDKVSLLIEYEPNILNISPPPPPTFTYIVLHCVLDSNTSSVDDSVSTGVSYTLIGSETIAQCPEILTSLETKYNLQIITRDYHSLNINAEKKYVYADLLLDSSTGVLIHSLKLLSSDSGLRLLINTLTSLSVQFNNCWLILTATDEKCYHFSGNIPANIAKLHASLSIHHKLHTGYSVKVLYAFSYDDVGRLVKDLIELRQNEAPLEWNEGREWLKEDFTQQELFLISFPCINSYSAQLMLRGKCLKDLLIMSLEELHDNFPSLPVRSLEMFYKICTLESSVYCDLSNEEQNVPQTLSPSPHSSPHPPINLFGTDVDTTDWNESELEMICANTSRRHRSLHLPSSSSSSTIVPPSTSATTLPIEQSMYQYHHSSIGVSINTGLPANADLPISLRPVDGALINETAQLPINNPLTLTADGSNVLNQPTLKDTSLSSDMRALQSTHHNEDKESGINSHLSFPPPSHSSLRSSLQRRPFKSLDLGFDTSSGSHTPLVTNDRPMVLGGDIPVDRRMERSDKRLPVLLERGVKRGSSTYTGLILDTAAPVDHRLSLERRRLSLEKEFLVNKRTQSSGQPLSSEALIPSHIRYGVATRSSVSNSNSHQEYNLHSSTLNSVPTFRRSFDNSSFSQYSFSSSLTPPSFKIRRKNT